MLERSPGGSPALGLFDTGGRWLGGSEGLDLEGDAELRARAVEFLRGGAPAAEWNRAADTRLQFFRIVLGGSPVALCRQEARGSPAEGLENQLLQLALGESAPAVFVDPALHITSCNEATLRLFGTTAAELVGRPVGTLFRDPESIQEILGRQLMAPGNAYLEEQTQIRRPDGAILQARVETMMLADERGQVVGFLMLVREQGTGGVDAFQRLLQQERMATMGEMAAQLAHEIRNPLVAIGAHLGVLGRESPEGPQRERLATLSREIGRLDMILRKHLSARFDQPRRRVSLSRVVEEVIALLEGSRKQAGKRITLSVDPTLSVIGDHEALKHMVFNLLLNALEASPARGEVCCRAATGPHDVSIIIEDRGPGLSASAAECFRPFFTTKKNGTGLGLSVCQKIARAHGGLVELRDREGGGCRAVLVLPRRAGASEAAT